MTESDKSIAAWFLSREVNAEVPGTIHGLNTLPFVLMPRIEKLLEDYYDYRRNRNDRKSAEKIHERS